MIEMKNYHKDNDNDYDNHGWSDEINTSKVNHNIPPRKWQGNKCKKGDKDDTVNDDWNDRILRITTG